MNTLMLVLLPATIGVDVGWQRYNNGAVEFIVQARPNEVDSYGLTGAQLIDRLPREYQFIRNYNYRIRTGTDPLPNPNTIPPDYRNLAATGPSYAAPAFTSPSAVPTAFPTPQNLTVVPNGYTQTPTGSYPSPTPTLPTPAPWVQPAQNSGYNPNVIAWTNSTAVGGVPTYFDPQSVGAAKPSIEFGASATTAGNFPPNQNYYQQQQPVYPAGTAEPKTPPDAAALAAAKASPTEPSSQWASLTFALVALFASLGANFYLGWTTFHLRERYRLMLADRPTY